MVDRAELLRCKKEANRRPSEEVRRFRLFERCLWVASYYRVIGREAYEERLVKAERMRRRSIIQGVHVMYARDRYLVDLPWYKCRPRRFRRMQFTVKISIS